MNIDFNFWRDSIARPIMGDLADDPDWVKWLAILFSSGHVATGETLLPAIFADRLATAEAAKLRLDRDLRNSLPSPPVLELQMHGRLVVITLDGNVSAHQPDGYFRLSGEEVAVEAAASVQDVMAEDMWVVWPTCPVDAAGLHARVVDARAVWYCEKSKHVVANVGDLASG